MNTSYRTAHSASAMVMNTFETSNRKLEQFLFAHDIRHSSWYKRQSDGMTVWVYPDTAEVAHIVAEYRGICKRRLERKAQNGRSRVCVQ